MMTLEYLEINQPIGTFYLTKIPAKDLIKIVSVSRRIDTYYGVQRELSVPRLKEISKFCESPDATFPTSIIVSVKSSDVDIKDGKILINNESGYIGEVLDGQHRLYGIAGSQKISEFDLPVVLMFDLTEEEKAYIFSTINSKQTRVSMSLIYDLFELSEGRSPQKTAHEIARSLNQMEESPFYRRLKMLGKRYNEGENATLSQGTFVKKIMSLYSRKPETDAIDLSLGRQLVYDSLPLRQYFIEEKDDIMLKILLNCFNALKQVFMDEWKNSHDNILWKTTGFGAVVYAFPILFKLGKERGTLTEVFFKECFQQFKNNLAQENMSLRSDFAGGGEQLQKKLSTYITLGFEIN